VEERAAITDRVPPVNSLSDETLLERLRSNDEVALATLFDRHARLVFGIAYRVLRDCGEAEELVQDLFLHLVASAERFDRDKGAARTWISHLAVHKSIDRRGFLARRGFYDGTDLEIVKDLLRGEEDIEAAVIRTSLGSQLRLALDELPTKQRVTLEWFFFDGCSLREISEKLGDSHFNVRHHFYRGLKKLRKNPIVARLKGERSLC
jgi:RNA polymerase sigma-70 factor (ECF subfamily)